MWLLAGIDLAGARHKPGVYRTFRLILRDDGRAQRVRYCNDDNSGRR
jgi:hypothetical protein